jgi:putative tryptophan/tyrosine transport system substrate-binding protein
VIRREFIAGLGSAAAWPVVARAQQSGRVRRIGFLIGGADENDPGATLTLSAFTQALADLGWTDGRNVRMDGRWGRGDNNRMRALAQELVGLQPDIIFASGTSAAVALQRETRTIPIVFTAGGDPVASGLVARLDRPYTLRLHKRARALIQDRADLIGFLAQDVHMVMFEVTVAG